MGLKEDVKLGEKRSKKISKAHYVLMYVYKC